MYTGDAKTDTSEEFCTFLQNLLQVGKRYALLFCGSSFELPIQYATSFATDLDAMFIPTDSCALPRHLPTPRNFHGTRFNVDTEDTYPGFARFYMKDGTQVHGRNYGVLSYHVRHGPAWTKSLNHKTEEELDVLFKIVKMSRFQEILRRLQEIKLDRVYAIYCPSWPTEADEWKTRERPNGWPTVGILDKIIASGCYFVVKPHHSNPDDDTQWRFSFSPAEVVLIHTWTNVQKYIYHILRLIKSEVVKKCGGSDETILCTYFFKTLMFWECERRPTEFWKDDNVENSVIELLYIMIEWFIDGICPSYFIPKCNMINASTERVDFSKEIQLLLSYTIMDITKVTTTWQRAYSKHSAATFTVVLSEEMLLIASLFQIRDNLLNPLNPKGNTKILDKLTRNDSLLYLKANCLYRGIMAHLRLMSECCPNAKGILAQEALSSFLQSLQEIGNQCSIRAFSCGESIYEILERLNSESNSKSDRESTNHHSDQLIDTHDSNIRQRYSHDIQGNACVRRLIRCYSRKEKDDDGLAKNNSRYTFVNSLILYCFTYALSCTVTATRVIGSAYLANFYYTAIQDLKQTHAVCETVLGLEPGALKGGRGYMNVSERAFPVFITNKLSAIFDEHFQTVLGLLTLHRYILDSKQDSSSVLVRICPVQLLKYLKIQCNRWEGPDGLAGNEDFKCSHNFHEWYDTYEPLSLVFMAAVLRASSSKT